MMTTRVALRTTTAQVVSGSRDQELIVLCLVLFTGRSFGLVHIAYY